MLYISTRKHFEISVFDRKEKPYLFYAVSDNGEGRASFELSHEEALDLAESIGRAVLSYEKFLQYLPILSPIPGDDGPHPDLPRDWWPDQAGEMPLTPLWQTVQEKKGESPMQTNTSPVLTFRGKLIALDMRTKTATFEVEVHHHLKQEITIAIGYEEKIRTLSASFNQEVEFQAYLA